MLHIPKLLLIAPLVQRAALSELSCTSPAAALKPVMSWRSPATYMPGRSLLCSALPTLAAHADAAAGLSAFPSTTSYFALRRSWELMLSMLARSGVTSPGRQHVVH